MLVLLLLFLVLIFSLIYLFINKDFNNQGIKPISEPELIYKEGIKSEEAFKPYLNTSIGQTTDTQITSLPNIKSINPLPNGNTQYLFPSKYSHLNNEIVTKDNKVVFKKIITVVPEQPAPQISSYITKYGSPDSEHTGSKQYGRFIKTYIFASKGFALVVNFPTGEVYEIHTFLPTTVDDYLNNWGDDIKQYKEEPPIL